MRKAEITQVAEALRSGQSLLVLGEPGSGKTSLAQAVRTQLENDGYESAIGNYNGSAKELLNDLCDQLGIDLTFEDGNKFKQKTALQLKADLLAKLTTGKRLLVVDDAHRWSASLRYWLEDAWRSGALLLLLAWQPQNKEIFAKLPIVKLEPIGDSDIRSLMQTEAQAQGVKLSIAELASLQQRAGNNPAIAKRVVREAALGLTETATAGHYQYIDGTPFLVILITFVGIVRFVGLGMGDKSIYIIGGLLTLAGLAVRTALYAANRGGRRL